MFRLERCTRVTLVILLTFFFFNLTVRSAEAQSFLYNYSAVKSGSDTIAAIFQDFNGDGRIDLASLNGTNTVSIMLGRAETDFVLGRSTIHWATRPTHSSRPICEKAKGLI